MVTNPLEFPAAWVVQIRMSIFDTDERQGPSLSSAVKVMDYPELKTSLKELLRQHCNIGVTDTALQIRLKPDTNPVYIPTYHLPHS